MGVDEFSRLVDLLAGQVGHWSAPRWAAPAARSGDTSRAELFHRLVQRLADLAADAEAVPRRSVPRLGNDLALADQFRVISADLAAADPPAAVLAEATELVAAVRVAL